MSWSEDNKWESDWWGNCANTYWEETKQIVYAKKMGLVAENKKGKWPVYDMGGASVLDIGGGPVSLLLKCENVHGVVIDPCDYPGWVRMRYKMHSLEYAKVKGEEVDTELFAHLKFDEVWIYNVLQHTIDPAKIIVNAKARAKIIRIFEWVETPTTIGHPHTLTEAKLNEWFGGEGKIEQLDEDGCHGKAYFGIFKGDLYV